MSESWILHQARVWTRFDVNADRPDAKEDVLDVHRVSVPRTNRDGRAFEELDRNILLQAQKPISVVRPK